MGDDLALPGPNLALPRGQVKRTRPGHPGLRGPVWWARSRSPRADLAGPGHGARLEQLELQLAGDLDEAGDRLSIETLAALARGETPARRRRA